MNRKILSLFASLALVALSACGDDSSTGSSKPKWDEVSDVTWEKLTDGTGTWIMDKTVGNFFGSASATSFGVTATELDLPRYAQSNRIELSFIVEGEGKDAVRYAVVKCDGDQCEPDDAEVWRDIQESSTNGVLMIGPSAFGAFLHHDALVSLHGPMIDQNWLYFPSSAFFNEDGKVEVFRKKL